MSKIVIKTPDGKYVGGGREPEIVDSLSRAYVYQDGPETDQQLALVNAALGCNWVKVDAEQELKRSGKEAG
jgi:hypothetical protein